MLKTLKPSLFSHVLKFKYSIFNGLHVIKYSTHGEKVFTGSGFPATALRLHRSAYTDF